MNRRAYIYIFAVAAAAITLLLTLPASDLLHLSSRDLTGLTAFISVAVLSEAMAIDFAVGPDRTAKSSVAFLPLFASAVIFPPIAAALAAGVVELFTELFFKRRLLWRASFNVSQSTLAIGLAGVVYNLHTPPAPGSIAAVAAFGALALTSFATNLILVSGFIAVRHGQAFRDIIRHVIGPGGGNLLYGLLASPVALAAALLYEQFDVAGLLMILLPLLLIRYSYLSKIQLQQANQDLLRVLIKAIETRDPYTSGHSLRVSSLARMIAEALGLSRRRAAQVETAALLHDIGKIDTIYAPIIRKPADLTDEERNVIRSHATKGADMLRTLSSVEEDVVLGVRHHHERFDGTGYPNGLRGSSIPLAARIIMISDSIDAMLSDRPYRRALSIEQARSELIRCSGTQFDPEIVTAVTEADVLERAAGLTGREPASGELVSGIYSAELSGRSGP